MKRNCLCKYRQLVVEMLVVGAIFALLMVVIARVLSSSPQVENRKVLIVAFAAGAFGHFAFEFTGVNAWYAAQYKPLL